MRARLMRDFGTAANQVLWRGQAALIGDPNYADQAVFAEDTWLARVDADHRSVPLSQKIIEDKPGSVADRCTNGSGTDVPSTVCDQTVQAYGTPRFGADEPMTDDILKCQLKPLRRDDYPVSFTDAQWQRLQQLFPTGVCDYTKPGVEQRPTIPWMTYQDSSGGVIYGGRPLGPAPVSVPFGPGGGCPAAAGRLIGSRLGPVGLGMTRARARRLFLRSETRGRRFMDFFCLTRIGIRAGYPSQRLLRALSRSQRKRVRGRVVLVLTANRIYALRGVHPGARLATVARRFRVGQSFHIGLNYWYLVPDGKNEGVLKVRHGTVEEIGIADKRLVQGRRAAGRFLVSFS
jgi:hypothetical protein